MRINGLENCPEWTPPQGLRRDARRLGRSDPLDDHQIPLRRALGDVDRLLVARRQVARLRRLEGREAGDDVPRALLPLELPVPTAAGDELAPMRGDRLRRDLRVAGIGRVVRHRDVGDPVGRHLSLQHLLRRSDGAVRVGGVAPAPLGQVGPPAAARCRQARPPRRATRSIADTRPTRSLVTPAATAALPPLSAISSTAPEPIRALCSSISAGRSLPVTPCTSWPTKGTPPTVRDASAGARRRPWRARAAAARPRSAASAAHRGRPGPAPPRRRPAPSAPVRPPPAAARARRGGAARLPPVSASIRRTPAADALSAEDHERTRCRRCAATCVPPHSSIDQVCPSAPLPEGARPIETTRTSSPYFSPNSACAPRARASSGVMIRVSTAEFWRTKSLTSASTRSSSPASTPANG